MLVIGRALLGLLYIVAGLRHYGSIGTIANELRSRNVPMPVVSCHVATAFQIVCGSLLMMGIEVRWAAFGLLVFTVVTTLVMVNFWRMSGPSRIAATNVFLAHIGVTGGLLVVAGTIRQPDQQTPALSLAGML